MDDPTIVLLDSVDDSLATVSSDDQIIDSGDLITYTITVENKGNTPLKSYNWDNLSDALGNTLKLSNGPFSLAQIKGQWRKTKIGEIATYIAFYSSNLKHETGLIINSVNASAENLDGTIQVSDISDDGDDTDGNILDDPTEVQITQDPGGSYKNSVGHI